MSKVFSIIFFYALFLPAFQNSSNLLASNSKLKIEETQIHNQITRWAFLNLMSFVKYDKLDADGLPVNLELLNGTENISFRFNKSKNEEIIYRYKFYGQDTIWKYCTNSPWVKFDKLKNGRYCFVLQEIINNKVNQVIKFHFYNNLNFYFLRGDFVNFIISLLLIWGIIKMK
jgi:hypothetical protein